MSGRKGMLHYRVEIKREAVRLVLEEHLTYAAVAAKLEIRKAERIEAWVGMYRREGEASFDKPIGRPLKSQGGEAGVNVIACALPISQASTLITPYLKKISDWYENLIHL